MNNFEKILYLLQAEMTTPKTWGWFHLMWIFLVIISLVILFKIRKKYNNKQLSLVLGIYGIIALILEATKQLIWSFNYDLANNIISWDYQWYAAPFQLCTTPIFVSLIGLFLKEDSRIKNCLLSYMAYVTILGSFMTMIIPDSCFTSDIVVNIHTMWLHCGSLVVSVYLLMSGAVKINEKSLIDAFKTFLFFVLIAEILNISIYNSGILNGETFNMFYISPYFISSLPVFDIIQQNLPFILYLLIYIVAIYIGSLITYIISYIIKTLTKSRKMS